MFLEKVKRKTNEKLKLTMFIINCLRNFLNGNSLELITFVTQRKIIADFPQLIIHKPLCVIQENET